MPRKYRFLAALLGVLLLLSLAVPALANEVDNTPAAAQETEEGNILPPDGDDTSALPPDGTGEPSDDPSSDPGQDPSQDPGSEPSDDPSSDPSSSDPSDDPSSDPGSDAPESNPGEDDPDGNGNWNGDPDEGNGDGNYDPGWDSGYTYGPSDSFNEPDDDFAGGTIINTAPGSTGSTTPRRPQQVLGGNSSESANGSSFGSGIQQAEAPVEASGPQYVTFARLNLRSNSMALTLFYGGAGCIALGVLGLIFLLIVLVRITRKNHRDRLIEEIAHAETQAAARSTETDTAAGTGRHVASHMRKASLKHSASRKSGPEDR